MRPLNPKKKILVFLALATLGLLLAPFVAVQIQERIFRHRAERLLADMRSLMMHKGNAEDMRAVFKRWGPFDTGCNGQNCWFHKDLEYSHFSDMHKLDVMNQSNRWLRLFRLLGGRPAIVHAHAEMLFGVRYMSYEVETEISSFHVPAEPYETNILWGEASIVGGFDIDDAWYGLTLHPNYLLNVRPPRPSRFRYPTVYAHFGPQADPGEIARWTSFDLSCLTSWAPCRKPGDLMPQAAAQFAKEEAQIERTRKDHACGPEIIGLMARTANYAGVVRVTEIISGESTAGEPSFANFRRIQDFTPPSKWITGKASTLSIEDENFHPVVASLPPEVHVGNRLIILADYGNELFFVDRCGIVPLNPANLELVQRAIAGNLPPAKP